MQTWAKRGVQAVVTSGMLAAGATNGATSPEARPARPSGDWVVPPGRNGHGGVPRHSADESLSGSLFPAAAAERRIGRHARPDQTATMEGFIDPIRDVLPTVEDEPTQEIPAIRDHEQTMHLAGWFGDPTGDRTVKLRPGRPKHALRSLPPVQHAPRRPARAGTPAEGFNRTLSWTGPIGDVVHRGAAAPDPFLHNGTSLDVSQGLVVPAVDLMRVEHFEKADGIVELWEDALGRGQDSGLVNPQGVDLTSGELAGRASTFHRIPQAVVAQATSVSSPEPQPKNDTVSLQVPGEHQERPTDLPTITGIDLVAAPPWDEELGFSRIVSALEPDWPFTETRPASAFRTRPLPTDFLVPAQHRLVREKAPAPPRAHAMAFLSPEADTIPWSLSETDTLVLERV